MRLVVTVLVTIALCAGIGDAHAQCRAANSAPNFTIGGNVFGMSQPQWKAYFAAKADSAGGVLCGPKIQNLQTPVNPGDAANKQYVDVAVSAPGTPHTPVKVATADPLPNTPIYVNGSGPVFASTLTSSANTPLVVDGAEVDTIGTRVLISKETQATRNGIYTLTQAGVGGTTPWVLTRAADFNTAALGKVAYGAMVLVLASGPGVTLGGSTWEMTAIGPITIGTTNLPWIETSHPNQANADEVSLQLVGGAFSVKPGGLFPAGMRIPGYKLIADSNADLAALPTSHAVNGRTTVQRLGYAAPGDGGAADYVYSLSACSLSSGAGDGGSEVPASGSGCWLLAVSPHGITPPLFGAVGDGSHDDTAAVQAAIAAASRLGVPLRFDAAHLYLTTDSLDAAAPIDIEGPYRYGVWTTRADGTARSCPWGIINTSGVDILRVSAVTATVRGLCVQAGAATGDGVSATAGAALTFAPPSDVTYQTGLRVEYNTLINVYDGLAVNGHGYSAACCGKGSTADGNFFGGNTIVNPAHEGISNGRNTADGQTVGNTYVDNAVVCVNATSHTSGVGVALYDAGITYDGTNNGPEGCDIGMKIAPGTISGHSQNAQGIFRGVLGDQTRTHDLLIQPASGGIVDFLQFDAAWVGATSDVNSVLIDGSGGGSIQEITFTNLVAHGGVGLSRPIFAVLGGANGPYDLSVVGSNVCSFTGGGAGATTGSVGVRLDLSAVGATSSGRYVIGANRIGTGCPGSSLETAIELLTGPANTANVNITGNDLSGATTPLKYSPQVTDNVVIANNTGIDTGSQVLNAASAVDLIAGYSDYFISGPTTINTINGAWRGRHLRFVSTAAGTLNLGTSGNICSAALSSGNSADLVWVPGGSCWSHVP